MPAWIDYNGHMAEFRYLQVFADASDALLLAIGLDNDETLAIDHVVLATGYRVNMQRVPFLAAGNILNKLALNEGYPVLDDGFQSSVAGLYVTSLPAIRDFGPFFGFTVAVGVSAKLIGQTLIENRRTG